MKIVNSTNWIPKNIFLTRGTGVHNEKLASFEDLKSRLLSFKNVVTDLNTENKFLSIAGTFANSSATDLNGVVDISTNNNAIAGTFSTAVQKLAREGKMLKFI